MLGVLVWPTKFGVTVRVCFYLSVDDITLQDLSLTPALGGLPVYLPAYQACLTSPFVTQHHTPLWVVSNLHTIGPGIHFDLKYRRVKDQGGDTNLQS